MRRYFNRRRVAPIKLSKRSLKLALSESLESRIFLNATLTSPIASPILNPAGTGELTSGSEELIKLSNHFDNPGGTGALTYNVSSSIPGVAQASISTLEDSNDPALYLVAGQVGTSEVTVNATDTGGNSASTTFPLTVGTNMGIVALTTPTPGSFNDDLARTFSGIAATGSNYSSLITITIHGAQSFDNEFTLTLTTKAVAGKFAVAPSSYPQFGSGEYQAYAVQTDSAGDQIAGFDYFINGATPHQGGGVSPPSEITTDNFHDEQVSVDYGAGGGGQAVDPSSISTSNISVIGPTGNPLTVQSYDFVNPGTGAAATVAYEISAPDANSEWTSALNGTYTININGTGGVMTNGGYTFGELDAATFVVDIPPTKTPPGGSITGTVFNDANGNGKQDSGDLGIANVSVYIDTTSAAVFKTGDPETTTNASGIYTFTGLSAGTYVVRQILPSGDTQTLPTRGYGNHVTLAANQSATNINFGDENSTVVTPPGGSISGTVFNDANGNGKQDSGELGIANVSVYIDTTSAAVFKTGDPETTTNASGVYTFTGLSAGAYVVRQILPSGDKQTLPTLGYGNHVTLTTGQAVINANFGDQGGMAVVLASITGTVFNVAEDTGISSVVLYIDLDNAGIFKSGDPEVTAGSNGVYTFSNLAAGTYIVRQMLPSGFTQITPTNNFGIHITVAAAQTSAGNNFDDKAA